MFTGIVTELGRLAAMDESEEVVRLVVEAPKTSEGLAIGESVAVNGVCLTAVGIEGDLVSFDAVPETMERSSLGALDVDRTVNLERPTPADGRFDGHIVQGHVDGVGTITSIKSEADSVRLRVSLPRDLARYVVEKGSIAVDGTSLTLTGVSEASADDGWIEFVLIPHTLVETVFGWKTVGDTVNLEVDVIAKYVERMLGERR